MYGAVIDIGNTRIKAAIFENDILKKKFDFENFNDLILFVKQFTVDIPVIISDVTSSDINSLNAYIKKLIILDCKTPIPIKNNYKTPDTLGYDRLAAAIGASAKYKNENVLVIDMGTCIKYDFINEKLEYYGGSISPGLEIKFQALNHFTQKLPLENKNYEFSLIGTTTSEAIVNGVMNGTLAEINGIIQEYKITYPNIKVVITGGDMLYFADKIKGVIFADPDLVFKGLYEVLKYNVK
ncbi:MAG: type III pantothenate kinase [Bacteroidetes bacterium]|nr:type III pantothenate kinase [Bacteroidota bacterium]